MKFKYEMHGGYVHVVDGCILASPVKQVSIGYTSMILVLIHPIITLPGSDML